MNPPLKPLSLLLRGLPDTLHSELLGRFFSHLLKGQYMAEQLHELDGKRLSIRITDSNTELRFLIRGGRIMRSTDRGGWDARISGTLANYWLLASRKEDPDTLFFNRTLSLEGDTETSLYLKNLLDSLDFDSQAHLESVFGKRIGSGIARGLVRSGLSQRLRQQF